MPATLGQEHRPNEETQMRYPSLNSNNPYLIPPPHPTPGLLAPLLLLQLITKPTLSPHVTSQAFPLPPGPAISICQPLLQNKASRLTTTVIMFKPHPFQPGVHLKSTDKLMYLLQHLKTPTHSLAAPPPSHCRGFAPIHTRSHRDGQTS